MKQHDNSEAMRLADMFELEPDADSLYRQAAALLRKQSERIAELEAERDRLRAEVERLRADAERLDWLESEADDLRTVTTGEDDYDWIVISHHMANPHEREVGRANTARAAIDAARTTHKETE